MLNEGSLAGESVHLGEMCAESGGLLPPLSAPFSPTLDRGLIQNPRGSVARLSV